MSDATQSTLADKIAGALEGAFDSVSLTRRAHFEANPTKRPQAADIERIISSYANTNALIAGGANMIPGPWGMLAVVPELVGIIRNQIQMIYDIGVAHGQEAHLDSKFLLAIFSAVMGGGAISLATVKGSQLLVKRASLRVIQKIIVWLGGKITQRVLKQLIAKWLPVVGAASMALWARQSTMSMGQKAAEMLKHEVRFSDEEVGEDELPG